MELKERKKNAESREKNLKFNRVLSVVRNLEIATLGWASKGKLEKSGLKRLEAFDEIFRLENRKQVQCSSTATSGCRGNPLPLELL